MAELRWIAKRNGWLFRHHKKIIEITEPDETPVATFIEIAESLPLKPVNERLAVFAALRA